VRRRSNGFLVQQATARWLVVAALAAAVVVVAALRAGRLAFGGAVLLGTGALCAASVGLVRQLGERWLAARDAAARIDRSRDLGGRLASLAELDGRARGGLFALLVQQNLDALARWRPEDVVPRLVSGAALASALAAVAALILVVVFAPWLRPPPPRVLIGDRPMDFVAAKETREGADRLLVTPGTEHASPGGTPDSGARSEPEADDSTLATLQDWLQEALGADERWETGGEVPPSGSRQDGTRGPRQDREPKARPVADARGPKGGSEVPGADGPATPRPGDGNDQTRNEGAAAPGAGTDTDPSLYGKPDDDIPAGGDRFELAIAARVRTRPGTAGGQWAAAPGAEAGRPPALAPGQRPEQPGHRMDVPASFAPIVRRLFAHADAVPGASP
jgi:hypothetical protein